MSKGGTAASYRDGGWRGGDAGGCRRRNQLIMFGGWPIGCWWWWRAVTDTTQHTPAWHANGNETYFCRI